MTTFRQSQELQYGKYMTVFVSVQYSNKVTNMFLVKSTSGKCSTCGQEKES